MQRKSYPSSKAISGMYFPSSASSGNCIPFQASILGRIFPLDPQPETASHFERKFRDAISRWRAFGKVCPTSNAQSGTHFPQSTSTENYVPFQRQIPGRIFRKPAHPESRPTLDASGHGTIDLSGLPSIKRRPPGRRGTKFIASSARKEGHLMWPSSCAGL